MAGWQARGGDVVMSVDEAERWGDSLGILAPCPIRSCSPSYGSRPIRLTSPETCSTGSRSWPEAADAAEAQQRPDDERPRSVGIHREGDSIIISPGDDVRNLALCLEVFARGVLGPDGPHATMARGATGYAAFRLVGRHRTGGGNAPRSVPLRRVTGDGARRA